MKFQGIGIYRTLLHVVLSSHSCIHIMHKIKKTHKCVDFTNELGETSALPNENLAHYVNFDNIDNSLNFYYSKVK